jgi:hypothetical protein
MHAPFYGIAVSDGISGEIARLGDCAVLVFMRHAVYNGAGSLRKAASRITVCFLKDPLKPWGSSSIFPARQKHATGAPGKHFGGM